MRAHEKRAHEKNREAARDLRAEAEALRQRDPWYHLQRGRWLRAEGDPVGAHRAFACALELDPKFTVAYHEMARNQFHCGYRGRPARADQILKACAREVPDDALTRALLAQELERKGRFHDALEQVEVATALEPDNPHYHCLNARVLRRIGRLDAAERAARRGIAADDLPARMAVFGRQSVADSWREYRWRAPVAPELHAELAAVLAAKGDWAAAEVAAREALARARTDPERHHRLSEILATRGRHHEAAAALEAAIALARQAFGRPTPRDWPLTDRNRHLEARARLLSRILSAGGRRNEALAVLREGLAAVPDSSALTNQLATLLAESGENAAAAALLRKALLKRPQDAAIRYRLSKALKATDPPQAIALAELAADLEPDNPAFQDHLVELLLAAERTDEAARALARALPRNARHGALYFRASRLMQVAGHSGDAIVAARRAVALDAGRARWHDHLAALLIDAGRPAEAEAVLRHAIERRLESGGVCFRLSRLWQRRRPQQALVLARRAVMLEPGKPHLREHLVALLIESGDEAEAGAVLSDGLECCPGHAALHFHHSRLLQRRWCIEPAVEAARRAVELEPWRPRWRDHLASLLVAAGRPAAAEAELRQALDQDVASGGMYFRLSRLLQERRPEDAVAALRRAVALEPHQPYLHERLAASLLDGENVVEAAAVLRDALELHPGYAALHFEQSRLWRRRRRPAEALAAAKRAVELDPGRRRWQDHLAVLAAAAGRRETMGSPEDEMDRPTVLAFPVTRSRRGRDRGPARTPAGAAAPQGVAGKGTAPPPAPSAPGRRAT
jgi:tetratricopeptide (TPR) repeat protein